jgi:FkbM family methyltransferase
MRATIIRALLLIYRLTEKSGLLRRTWGKKLFLRSYLLYKKHLEDPFDALIKSRPDLFKGGHILDIGANIGYTASLFSKATDRESKVYCFEPDASSFALLKEVISSQANHDQMVPVMSAVGSGDGTVELWHNPAHQGDHRILTPKFRESGIEADLLSTVPLISVDNFARGKGIQQAIKFIKIDVQGYELAVCQGTTQTLEQNPDLVIALEYAPDTMKELGFEPDDLIAFFQQRNYHIYILKKDGTIERFNDETLARALDESDYRRRWGIDLLVSRREIRCESEEISEDEDIVAARTISQNHFFSTYNFQLIIASLILISSIWFSSGTMAPYGATLSAPMVLSPCAYLVNIDHLHHKAVFLMLDGADKSEWNFSVLLRRALFSVVAFPFMKLWGYESGGFFASVLFHLLSFFLFISFLRKEIGEKAALLGMWLLATYPGIPYWAALPYAYAAIVPCCLLATILLWQLNKTIEIKKAFGLSLLLGLLFTAYDLLPFFGLAALVIVVVNRRFVHLPGVLFGLLIPPIVSNLLLREIYGVSLSNSNTVTYYYIIQSYLHWPDWEKWARLLRGVPRIAVYNYLFSNFLFLPALFLLLYALNFFTRRLKFTLVEKAILFSVIAVFLFNNLAPPYPGWQLRGDWVSRLYQPVFPALILFSVRKLGQSWSLGTVGKTLAMALFTVTVLANASIAFGPIMNNPYSSNLYYRFYKHPGSSSPTAMLENLRKYGRRPLGFCDNEQAERIG